MYIKSTNIANAKTIIWNNKEEQTGIFKIPTTSPIYLGKSDVKNDQVIDRKYHGGEFKACYLFSENEYKYWKSLYPDLNWEWGMFGENLTVSNLDETKIFVGDIFQVGTAIIQITEPREPCYKLGIKFGTQDVLKQFIKRGYSGTYVRVLQEGFASSGDALKRIQKDKNKISVHAFFNLLYNPEKDKNIVKSLIESDAIPAKKKEKLLQFIS
ncbi:MOSC domain-containing protein [Aestuariibaculum sediminum]|uniref:MOSC domain-containing protein n=1 Tax=Aestuariibaculum sediminum TaxID=2770637 RepID=A0A8J6Q0B9_9FLAO|nr:MOSC domain-containing protein [Aestuariibaculum sediminum]MBD0833048.1 MOSC domain-containing protein [Aestuariibaculum sediminum]